MKIDLKTVSAYWCNRVSDDYEQRFSWSNELVDETVRGISNSARRMLVVLSRTIPDDYAAAYFAAGPLEDYINLIVREQKADEADFIMKDHLLRNLLPLVWGDIDKLYPLAKVGNYQGNFSEPRLEQELKTLDVRQLMGFWCRICSTSGMGQYDIYYNQVLKKLLNKKEREDTMHDITMSAPDDKLLGYVRDTVFVLQS